MNNLYFKILIIGFFNCFSVLCYTQVDIDQHDVTFTIPEIALVDIEPDNTTLTLTLDQPADGGAPVIASSGGTNATKWLNYSSCLSPSATNRNVLVQISSGTVPPGIELKLEASNSSGIGQGILGSSTGLLTLNTSAQILISGIGGAFTGDGSSNGHQLTYSILINNYALLDFNNTSTIEVTYTITD